MNRVAILALALILAACTERRTEIILRIRTDMTQGPTAELAAIRVRVWSDGITEPHFDEVYQLGVGDSRIVLPQELGLVPASDRDRLVHVQIDARSPDGTIFEKRASARYVRERTLLLDVMLARRCRDPAAQLCPSGQSCDAIGCEDDLRDDLPNWEPLDEAGVPPPRDGGMDAMVGIDAAIDGGPSDGGAMDGGPMDGGPIDGGPIDGGPIDGGPIDGGPIDGGPPDSGPMGEDAGPGDPTIPPPQPIEPGSTVFTTSWTVRFRWALTSPATGARLEICRDRACTDVRQMHDVNGDTFTATVMPDALPSSRVFYFRLTGRDGANIGNRRSPVWSFSVQGRTGVTVSGSWGSTNDTDGDGMSEVLVGAPASSVVRLYRGRNPIGTSPATPNTVISSTPALRVGTAVVRAGDVNGDGFADLAIGTMSSVLVYHGVLGGLPSSLSPLGAATTITDTIAPTRENVAPAGDVDGDGYADLVVGDAAAGRILLYRGGGSGLASTGIVYARPESGFGTSVGGSCDVNADGFSDVIVGGTGNAVVFLGSVSGLGMPVALTPGASSLGFGASVACAGDVNGDGYADVIVGAPLDDSAFVYHGTGAGVSVTPNGALRKVPGETGVPTKHGDAFGTVVDSAGDVNGDGFSDVVVVAPEIPTGVDGFFVGYSFGFNGTSSGLPSTAVGSSTAHSNVRGSTPTENRPQVSAYSGDVDGDGYGELVTGVPFRSGGSGGAFLHRGTSSGLPTTAQWDLSAGALLGFGTTVAMRSALGDVVNAKR